MKIVTAPTCCPVETQCMSQWGYCGEGPAYCGTGCKCGPCGNTSIENGGGRPPQETATTTGTKPTPTPSSKPSAPPTNPQGTKTCTIIENFDSLDMPDFKIDYCDTKISAKNGTATIKMDKECGSRISSKQYFMTGYAEARIRTAKTSGVVTSFITRSDESKPNDEIDFEILGKDPTRAQTNVFKDSVLDYSNAGIHDVKADTTATFNTYGISWEPNTIEWKINGVVVRSMQRASSKVFPQGKPMAVQMAVWDGSQTSGWAGVVNFGLGSFTADFDYVKIEYKC